MRLEPVYLLGPKPEPEARTAGRRAFLMGLLCSSLGAGFLGYQIGRGSSRGVEDVDADAQLDSLTVWALSLQSAPIEDLLEHQLGFLLVVDRTHDSRLREGVRRLAEIGVGVEPASGTATFDQSARRSLIVRLQQLCSAWPEAIVDPMLRESLLRGVTEIGDPVRSPSTRGR